jgi:hypothetical protein
VKCPRGIVLRKKYANYMKIGYFNCSAERALFCSGLENKLDSISHYRTRSHPKLVFPENGVNLPW